MKRTRTAISAFYHGAEQKKDLPPAFSTIPFPAWATDAALGGKSKQAEKLISVLDLFGAGSQAKTDAPKEKKPLPAYTAGADDDIYLETLLLWGKENLDALPSADAYVSRFEAGRLSAALACIALDTANKDSPPPVTLLAGDLSGVQNFIYTITNKGATSALRGRSLYLQLLTEAIARYALKELELPISNLLYMGGGQFHILAGDVAEKKLADLRKKISRKLLSHHKGALSLTLAEVSLTPDDLQDGEKLAGKRQELNKNLQERKKRRFSELGNDLAKLFEPQEHGGNEEFQCSVCGTEDEKAEPIKDSEGNDTGNYICLACKSYEGLGKKLRKAQYLGINLIPADEKENPTGEWQEVLNEFGMEANFYDKQDDVPPQIKILLAINEEALKDLKPSPTRAVGRRYLVSVTPLIEEKDLDDYEQEKDETPIKIGDIKPFKMLAEQANGIQRLGVLRMDVDDLGALFESGLKNEATLGRLNALSGQISKFFEGEVEKIAKETDAGRLYSIYSGGDDLFFVGAWDAVINLAIAIRQALSDFSGNNPKIHASAGIVLISNKYPLAQAAQLAGEAEQKSKSLLGKDAVTFLGQTFKWENFSLGEDTVQGMTQKLNKLLKDNKARAPIYKLLQLYAQYQEALAKRLKEKGETQSKTRKKQALWGRWMWLGYYYLTKKNIPDDLKEIAEELKKTDFNTMAYVGVSARWAMLLNRKNSKKKDEGGMK